MGLLGDVGHVEPHFDPFGDSVSVVQDSCTICTECTIGSEIVLDAPSLGTWVMWILVLICLEIVLVLVQDRCTVCARCTIGSKIVLDAPSGTPR